MSIVSADYGCAHPELWFTCSDTKGKWITSDNETNKLKHIRDSKQLLTLGSLEIPIIKRTRTFLAEYTLSISSSVTGFVLTGEVDQMTGEPNAYPCGISGSTAQSGSISEDYQTIASVLHYLDIKNNIAVWSERTYNLKFKKTFTGEMLTQFKSSFEYHNYFLVDLGALEAVGTSEVKFYHDGITEILSTVSTGYPIYSLEEPLRIVYPHPPCTVTPVDPTLNTKPWYDYCLLRNTNGGQRDFDLMGLDGGDDFYYPKWCRLLDIQIGSNTIDKDDAFNRFYTNWLTPERVSGDSVSFKDVTQVSLDSVPLDNSLVVGIAKTKDALFYSVFGDNKGTKINIHKVNYKDKEDNPVTKNLQDIIGPRKIDLNGTEYPFNSKAYYSFGPMGVL